MVHNANVIIAYLTRKKRMVGAAVKGERYGEKINVAFQLLDESSLAILQLQRLRSGLVGKSSRCYGVHEIGDVDNRQVARM